MFPHITDLFNFLLGTHWQGPVQTYGFFLAIAFLTGGAVVRAELIRKEKEGLIPVRWQTILNNKPTGLPEMLFSSLLTSIVGYKAIGIIWDYRLIAENPQHYLLSSEGNLPAALLLFLMSVAAFGFRNYRKRKIEQEWVEIEIHPYQETWNIMLVAIISALIGSKLFDIADNFSAFWMSPLQSLFSFSGLTFYGGLITTVVVLLLYMRVVKLDWRHVIDVSAPAIMIGYAIGRLGCHFSGDGCWGIVNELAKPGWLAWLPDWAWAYDFPHNVANHGSLIPGCTGNNCSALPKPVWPTSLYESAVSFLFFGGIWILRRKLKAPVTLFSVFLIMNGTERFLIEKIRVNNRIPLLGMHVTQAEIISFLLFFAGIATFLIFRSRHQKSLNPETAESPPD